MTRKQTTLPNEQPNEQTHSPSYRLAFQDADFLAREDLRSLRIYMEMLKPEMELVAQGIKSTVVLFGGAKVLPPEQTPKTDGQKRLTAYYEQARRFAFMLTEQSVGCENVIVTGGGPGVMEAGNRGAKEAGGRSISLNIVLPFEATPNIYCTPDLCFNFHYFATRKFHFLLRAKAVVVFPGGFGTLDELFETLTLVQTERMARLPILLFGREFWEGLINFDALVAAGTVAPESLDLFQYVETAEDALAILAEWDANKNNNKTPPIDKADKAGKVER